MKDRNKQGQFIKGFKHPPKKIKLNLRLLKKEYLSGKSTYDLSKEFNTTQKTIYNRLKEIKIKLRRRWEHTERTKGKIRNTLIRKGIKPKQRYSGIIWNKGLTQKDDRVRNNIKGLMEARKYQVIPVKDTSIELKIQNLLKQLGIDFLTHQYIKIEHAYQCDIFIPVQQGITKKTIIECFGTYWHNYPIGRQVDIDRCNELRKAGWRVLVFWENEIKKINKVDLLSKLLL